MRRLVVLDSAQQELEAVTEWYAERAAIAADAFIAVVASTFASIRESPGAAPAWPGRTDVRARRLGRFPFRIVYLAEAARVVVVALAHDRRRPGYWLERLR